MPGRYKKAGKYLLTFKGYLLCHCGSKSSTELLLSVFVEAMLNKASLSFFCVLD